MKKIQIEFSQVLRYYQTIEVTEEQYKELKENYDGRGDLSIRDDEQLYYAVSDQIDFRDVFDSEEELQNIMIHDIK